MVFVRGIRTVLPEPNYPGIAFSYLRNLNRIINTNQASGRSHESGGKGHGEPMSRTASIFIRLKSKDSKSATITGWSECSLARAARPHQTKELSATDNKPD